MLAALLELAPAGVEQVDGDGFVEYALYGAPGELPSLPDGEAEVGGVRVRSERRPGGGRLGRALAALPRARAGRRPGLRAPAVGRRRDAGTIDLVIDPGQAFGTGAHATTRLCLELLLELEPPGSFADLGCGSGVLAIAAARLGFAPVTAVDSERAAVEATLENAARTACGSTGSSGSTCATARRRRRGRSPPTSCARCCCAWRS